MGKNLKGKEIGKGICQRKDGLFVARFKSALMNDMILKRPMNGVLYTKPVRAVDDIHFLTIDEQRRFLETAKRSRNYRQYALILETGLHTGELIGLTWDAIDFEKRTPTVNKTLEYGLRDKVWRAGPRRPAKATGQFL